ALNQIADRGDGAKPQIHALAMLDEMTNLSLGRGGQSDEHFVDGMSLADVANVFGFAEDIDAADTGVLFAFIIVDEADDEITILGRADDFTEHGVAGISCPDDKQTGL